MGMIGEYLKVDEKTFKQIKKGKSDLFELTEILAGENGDVIMDIDKAWHAIHFVLSGKAWDDSKEPISKMVFSGNELGEDTDSGYGPATYLTPKEVNEISMAANNISKEWFRQRFDINKMKENEIYLIETSDEPEEELFEYVWNNFDGARSFFNKAAEEKQFIIFSIC